MKNVVALLDSLETKIGSENFKDIFKSITFDNGSEFKDFKGMENGSDPKAYDQLFHFVFKRTGGLRSFVIFL